MLNPARLGLTGRRDFLRLGGLTWGAHALGALGLNDLLRANAWAESNIRPVSGKSVVFLFMHGGPSQIETFDPKMTAPAGVHSVTGEIDTALSGVTFGSTFPRLASLANRMTVVRSYQPGNASHDIKPIVSPDTAKTSLGAIYARIAGSTDPRSGMPTNCALYPQAVAPECQPAKNAFGNFGDTGILGASYAPFVPGGGGNLQNDMKLNLSRARIDDRRALLAELDRLRRELETHGAGTGIDAIGAAEKIQQQAFDTILGGAVRAFDLSNEDRRTIERYDTAPLLTPDQISSRWRNYNNYVDHGKSLGKLMLLARRLCESGCGFVSVTTNFVWDNHADVNNCGVEEGMQYCGRPFDHAVSTFIEDVAARGLSDKILLVCCGEIGRTPRINARGGRDHWGNLAPLILAGGKYGRGQVIGQSTSDAGDPLTEPVTTRNLIATVFDHILDVPQVRLLRGMPPELMRAITEHSPIGV